MTRGEPSQKVSWTGDAFDGARLMGLALLLPVSGTALRIVANPISTWYLVIPFGLMAILMTIAALVVVRHNRYLRRVAGSLRWYYARNAGPSVDTPQRLYPFTDKRRQGGAGALGWWHGHEAKVLSQGARLLLHIVEHQYALPSLQLVPTSHKLNTEVERGRTVEFESDEFNSRWRVVAGDPAYAHAVLPPHSLERLARLEGQLPVIAIHGNALWTTDQMKGDDPEWSRQRLDLLYDLYQRIPRFALERYGTAHALDDSGLPLIASNEHNIYGRLGVMFGLSVLLAPIGLGFAWAGRRALSRRKATNRGAVRVAFIASWVGIAILAGAVLATVLVS